MQVAHSAIRAAPCAAGNAWVGKGNLPQLLCVFVHALSCTYKAVEKIKLDLEQAVVAWRRARGVHTVPFGIATLPGAPKIVVFFEGGSMICTTIRYAPCLNACRSAWVAETYLHG